MTELPKASESYLQERIGIAAVAQALAKLGVIWRETDTGDVGIDGQIEYVDDEGRATGHIVAAQVKSGASYFRDGGDSWLFYPAEKHKFYWERFPVPVVLFLHDPDLDVVYWVDVRQHLRSAERSSTSIQVPKAQVLHKVAKHSLFAGTGASGRPFMKLDELLKVLVSTHTGNASFPISYFDLFSNGLTNICRSLYFGMDLAMEIAESKLDGDHGISLGSREQDFLFGYTELLMGQHIANIPFSDCLIDWYDRELQPTWLASLSSRGRALIGLIDDLEEKYVLAGHLSKRSDGIRVAQEDFLSIVWSPSHYRRLERISDFQKAFHASGR